MHVARISLVLLLLSWSAMATQAADDEEYVICEVKGVEAVDETGIRDVGWRKAKDFDRTSPQTLAQGIAFAQCRAAGLSMQLTRLRRFMARYADDMKIGRAKRVVDGAYLEKLTLNHDAKGEVTTLDDLKTESTVVSKPEELKEGGVRVTIDHTFSHVKDGQRLHENERWRITCVKLKDDTWAVSKLEAPEATQVGMQERKWAECIAPAHEAYWEVAGQTQGPNLEYRTNTAEQCAESLADELRLTFYLQDQVHLRHWLSALTPHLDVLYTPELIESWKKQIGAGGTWEERALKRFSPMGQHAVEDVDGNKRVIFKPYGAQGRQIAATCAKAASGWRVIEIGAYHPQGTFDSAKGAWLPSYVPVKDWKELKKWLSISGAKNPGRPIRYLVHAIGTSGGAGLGTSGEFPIVEWHEFTPFDRSTLAGLTDAFMFYGTTISPLFAEYFGAMQGLEKYFSEINRARILRLVDKSYFDSLPAAGANASAYAVTPLEPTITTNYLPSGEAEVSIRLPMKVRFGDQESEYTTHHRITCRLKDGLWAIRKLEDGDERKGASGKLEINWRAAVPGVHRSWWALEHDGAEPGFDPSTGDAKSCAGAFLWDLPLELRVVSDRRERRILQKLVVLTDPLFDAAYLREAREKERGRGTWLERLKKRFKERKPVKEEDVAGGKRFIFEAGNFFGDACAITVSKGGSGWRVTRIEKYEEKNENKDGKIVTTPIFTPMKTWEDVRTLCLG